MVSDIDREAAFHERADGSSTGRHAAKRLRSTSTNDGDSGSGLALPPEVWAGVLEYLPFQTVMSCAATSRSMLHDAMPRVTKFYIDKSSQLNLTVAARFQDVREIHINSLLSMEVLNEGTGDEVGDIKVDFESKIRVVPFLSRFDKLERVFFGGKKSSGKNIEFFAPAAEYFWEGDDLYPNEGERERMLAFIDHVSGAFRCGALPKQLKISGLCCPESYNYSSLDQGNSSCETCLRACKSFPLESASRFEFRGSSIGNARSGRPYGLDVCITRAQIDSIIESRPGGRVLLRTEERLLRLLSTGRRYQIVSNDRKVLYIVKYQKRQLDEIKSAIKYAELDVKKISKQKVFDAIMRSFTKDERYPIPPKNQCYLSESSLSLLKDEIGLGIDKEEFCIPLMDMLDHAHRMACIIVEGIDYSWEYYDIFIDCLRLIRRFLELENNTPIQQISHVIPSLARYLDVGTQEFQLEAARSLKNILVNGTNAHRKIVIDAGVIPLFSRRLLSPEDSIVKVAVFALANIVAGGMKEHIKAIVNAGGISKLVGLLDSNHEVCVESSLRALAIASNDHARDALAAGVLPHIFRLLRSPDQVDLLANCLIVLCKVLDLDNPPIQLVIDSAVVQRLVEIIQTNEDHAIQTNMAHVMINLTTGTSDQTDLLMQEAGFLSILVGLVNFIDEGVAEKAISAVGKIAKKHHNLVLGAGVLTSLLRLLEHSNTVSTLRVASWTFAKLTYCNNNNTTPRFATTKESLMVMNKLLLNEDNDVVCNSSWALFNLLDGMNSEELNGVINMGFAKTLLKLLADGSIDVQLTVLKSIYVITTAGDACIQSIADDDSIACIKKSLSSSRDSTQKLACNIISNIIAGNEGRIQTVIDSNVVTFLIQILTSKRNKRHALWSIYQMTKGGSASQIKDLVRQDIIHHLCDVLITDCNTAIISLWALRNILNIGKSGAKPSKLTSEQSISSNVQMIESKLEELTSENLRPMKATQLSDQRRADIDALRAGLRKLFKSKKGIAPKKKKKRDLEDTVEPVSEDGVCEEPKKKVQATLSSFYGKASKTD